MPTCSHCAFCGATNHLTTFYVEQRPVILCSGHASAIQERNPASFTELQQFFRGAITEEGLPDRRSAIGRRDDTTDRRVFARPESRRLNAGRRTSDTP